MVRSLRVSWRWSIYLNKDGLLFIVRWRGALPHNNEAFATETWEFKLRDTCAAVTSVGECFNYLFDADMDADSSPQPLMPLFHRIYDALIPGGVLIFDMAEPGQVMQPNPSRSFAEGEDWFVLVEKEEDREQATLVRRIITFRKIGDLYRRDDEVHHLRLYESEAIAEALRRVGFQVQVSRSYGAFDLPEAHAAFIAHKPA